MAKQTEPTQANLLASLHRLRESMEYRENLLRRVRGQTTRRRKPDPRDWPIPTSGGTEILKRIASGRLEVITKTLVLELINELETHGKEKGGDQEGERKASKPKSTRKKAKAGKPQNRSRRNVGS